MLEIVLSGRFKRDMKRATKRGYNLKLLADVVNTLACGEILAEKYRDHGLVGEYIGFRECHVQPDWLLIYRIDNETVQLFLLRTGTHADLFEA